mgnify:FL=1
MDAKDVTFLPVRKWEQRASNILLLLYIMGIIAYSLVYILGPNTLFWYGSGLSQMELQTIAIVPFYCGFAGLMTLFGIVIHRIGRSHFGWMSIAVAAWLFAFFLIVNLCADIVVMCEINYSSVAVTDNNIINIASGLYLSCISLSLLCYVYILVRSLFLSKGDLRILFVKQLATFCAFLILFQFCLPTATTNAPWIVEIPLILSYVSVVLYIGILWRRVLDAAHLHAPSMDNTTDGMWLLRDEEDPFIDE